MVTILWAFNHVFFISNLWAFAWAIRKFFVRDDSAELPPAMRRLTVIGAFMALLFIGASFVHSGPSLALQAFATLLMTLSATFFASALMASRDSKLPIAFSNLQPAGICTTGPYKWVRHPFYFSYSLTWLAGALMSERIYFALPAIIMIVIYWRLAASEEEGLLHGPFRQDYQAYRDTTWRLFPKFF